MKMAGGVSSSPEVALSESESRAKRSAMAAAIVVRVGVARAKTSDIYPIARYTVRGLANVNDEHTFLEDGYQLVPRTRQGASLNGCLGNNVELFPIFFF